jgi:hypothetical protein
VLRKRHVVLVFISSMRASQALPDERPSGGEFDADLGAWLSLILGSGRPRGTDARIQHQRENA